MFKNTAIDRTIQLLPKLRLTVRPGQLLAEPVVEIGLERQSASSVDRDRWHAAGEPVRIPIAQLEELVFEMREAAREAVA